MRLAKSRDNYFHKPQSRKSYEKKKNSKMVGNGLQTVIKAAISNCSQTISPRRNPSSLQVQTTLIKLHSGFLIRLHKKRTNYPFKKSRIKEHKLTQRISHHLSFVISTLNSQANAILLKKGHKKILQNKSENFILRCCKRRKYVQM